jgi:hypothetical protein
MKLKKPRKPDFSAGPQFLGYLYQAHYALYVLLKETEEEAGIIIEGLDDIELGTAKLKHFKQLKHHIKKKASLSSLSVDLWKTIRVWSAGLKAKEWKPLETKLTLITTATAPKSSIASFLRDDGNRDPDAALKKMVKMATGIYKSTRLKDEFDAFNALTKIQQKLLVQAIVIADASPNIVDIEKHIKDRLQFSVTKDKLQPFCNSILGWWYKKVAQQLLVKATDPSKAQAIKWIDLSNIIDEMRTLFQRDSLPVTFPRAEPEENFYADQEGRMFVRQIKCLDVEPDQIRLSIKKYYRAVKQRTEWAGELLLYNGEMDGYDQQLRERWAEYIIKLKRKEKFFGKLDKASVCAEFGRRVLNWIEEVDIPIRNSMPANSEYVTHGSYHLLADADRPTVHWHPNFLDQL